MGETNYVVAQNSQWRSVLLLGGSFVFFVCGLLMVFEAQNPSAGWQCILLFGPCCIFALWQLQDRGPQLIIDGEGILDLRRGLDVLPWSEIRSAFMKSIRGTDFICLDVRKSARRTGRTARTGRVNRILGFSDVTISVSGLSVPKEEIFGLILKHVELAHGVPARCNVRPPTGVRS